MDEWLERATNVAIIASAVLFAGVVANSWRAQSYAPQSSQPADVLERFLSANGITVDSAVSLSDPSKFKMNATPAFLVVNRAGVIESLWVGQIPVGDEDDAMRAVVAN